MLEKLLNNKFGRKMKAGLAALIAGACSYFPFSAYNANAGSETQYVCIGWTMTGNEPTGGTGTHFTASFTNDAVLTWNWKTKITEDVLISSIRLSAPSTIELGIDETSSSNTYSFYSSTNLDNYNSLAGWNNFTNAAGNNSRLVVDKDISGFRKDREFYRAKEAREE